MARIHEDMAALVDEHRIMLEACRKIVQFHSDNFVGLPLCIDGKPINHTLLNQAAELAQRAIQKWETP